MKENAHPQDNNGPDPRNRPEDETGKTKIELHIETAIKKELFLVLIEIAMNGQTQLLDIIIVGKHSGMHREPCPAYHRQSAS